MLCNCTPFPCAPSQMYSFTSWLKTSYALCFLTEKTLQLVFYRILAQNQWRRVFFWQLFSPVWSLLLWQLHTSSWEGCLLYPWLPFRVSTSFFFLQTKVFYEGHVWNVPAITYYIFVITDFPKERKFSCKWYSLCGISSKRKKVMIRRMPDRAWILLRKAATSSFLTEGGVVSKGMEKLTWITAEVSVEVFISSEILKIFLSCRWLQLS